MQVWSAHSSDASLWRTDDGDFDLPGHRGHVVLQRQAVGALIWTHAGRHHQLGEGRLGHHGDTLAGGQLLVSEGPLGAGSWVPGDGHSDGEGVGDDHLQAIFKTAQV